MTLKSLNDFNGERNQTFICTNEPVKNGIACPNCGAEMWDTAPMVTLTSNPPQKNVGCKECDYRGYRLA